MLTPSLNLLTPLLHGTHAERLFASEHQLAAMVRSEIALAYALETTGLAPAGTGLACEHGSVGFPTVAHQQAIATGAASSGNIAIPFVKLLTDYVRSSAPQASDFIHFGATSQDLLDTALVLTLRDFATALDGQIGRLIAVLISLTEQHRNTLLAGRTWMQQGPPVSFGLKTAQWLAVMLRHRERIAAAGQHVAMLQFGGAVGTLASLGTQGSHVAKELASRLNLACPDIPWHSQRDTVVDFATFLALLDGTLGKIARDLSLMVQTEFAEVQFEVTGGSSTMPHKRNPVDLAVVLSAAVRAPGIAGTMLSAMVQEHERGLGGWHAEWETLPDLCRITERSIGAMNHALSSLTLDSEAMRRNMDRQHGLAMAEAVAMRLSPFLGRPAAHALLEHASRAAMAQNKDLSYVLCADEAITKHLSREQIHDTLDPTTYLGSTATFIDQVLATASEANHAAH
jgi:3-carboxy-cis,cis-muconate cycloisomerase